MMKYLIAFALSICFLNYAHAESTPPKAADKAKKSKPKSKTRATSSDIEEISAEELRLIEEARKAVAEGRPMKRPKGNLQDRMQDQIYPLNED